MDDFPSRRRQRFISEQYFNWLSAFQVKSIEKWTHTLPVNGTVAVKRATAAWLRATDQFELMMLKYTAGEPIAKMRHELEAVVYAYEEYASRQRGARNDQQWPALLLTELPDYERAIQLIGLCHLLRRRDLLPRIAVLEDAIYRGQDTLYEDLLAYGMEGRVDVDQWYHESYRDCINSIYVDGDDESVDYLNAYLENWYAAMESVGGMTRISTCLSAEGVISGIGRLRRRQ